MKPARDVLHVGTWNVRTLYAAGKHELLKLEMSRYKCDILGISEMRWSKEGETPDGHTIWSGLPDKHEAGVGFLLSTRAKKALLRYRPVNARIIMAQFSGQPRNITVIHAYAPTTDAKDDVVEEFYTKLNEIIKETNRKDILIVTGDWNAKIGEDREGWEEVMGQFGYGKRNERGERLLEFATDNQLAICNTFFKHKACHKWTWRTGDNKHKNMIDLVLIAKRWKDAVQNCRSFQGADIGSDHSLVIANITLKLKAKKFTQQNRRRDIIKLTEKETGDRFREVLHKNIEQLNNLEELDDRTNGLTKAIMDAVEETIPITEKIKKKWITEETLLMIQHKRRLRNNRDQSEAADKEYRESCKKVTIATRADQARWLEQQCEILDKNYGEGKLREVYKMVRSVRRAWQPKLSAIKDRNGRVLTDKKEIRRRWTEYCGELYAEQTEQESTKREIEELQKISPPTVDTETNIIMEEVEQAIKKLRNNKSPGNDNITAEMIKQGGEPLVKEIHRLCNMAWEQGRAPEEWKRSILITIHKKGSALDCENFRTISLISHMGKILMMILTERLRNHLEEHISDEQAGFRKNRSTTQQILMLKLIAEKARRKGRKIYNCFVDFKKAFDSVDQGITWAVLKSYGVDSRLINLLRDINETSQAAVRVDGETEQWFKTNRGTRQGDPISPTVFIADLERAMDKIKERESGISIQGININNLRFADDVDLLEEKRAELEHSLKILNEEAKKYGLAINIGKTKMMIFGGNKTEPTIEVDGHIIENVERFTYLGSNFECNLDDKAEIKTRLAKAYTILGTLDKIWRSSTITMPTKMKILNTTVFSTALYGCETWTLTAEIRRRILAFESKCYRRILRVKWTEKITNDTIFQRVNRKETILQKVIKRKMNLFGHIARMGDDRKLKTLVFGVMEGNNRRGRPHREWTDDIEDWGKDTLQRLYHLAQSREGWRMRIKLTLETYEHDAHGA